MDFTKEAIDAFVDLAPTQELRIGDLDYTNKPIHLVMPPVLKQIQVGTLTGFVHLLESDFETYDPSKMLVHVVSYDKVQFVAKNSDPWGRRVVAIDANAQKGEKEFRFDTYYGVESFNIALRSLFMQTPELNDLISLASKITQSVEGAFEDDGISQKVTAKTGVGPIVGDRVIKPLVTLKPFRTFREVDQPSSDYVFRVKQTDAGIQCALFEADGGTWKLTAIATVATWLANRMNTSELTTLGSIPVIA